MPADLKKPTVFVITDEPETAKVVEECVRNLAFQHEQFQCEKSFLHAYDPSKEGCLVLDEALPQIRIPEFLASLKKRRTFISTIFITSAHDCESIVEVMRAGIFDVLFRPLEVPKVKLSIQDAVQSDGDLHRTRSEVIEVNRRLERLAPREREVFNLVVQGKSSKAIASELAISSRTVDVHRAHIMIKLEAKTAIDLVRFQVIRDDNHVILPPKNLEFGNGDSALHVGR